jgi:fumarate hydratase class II
MVVMVPMCCSLRCLGFGRLGVLGDMCEKLREFSVDGTQLDTAKGSDYVARSLMLVTPLSPVIGYDKASAVSHRADDEGCSLREASLPPPRSLRGRHRP